MLTLEHLRKSYASAVAVEDVSLTANGGEILGLLGPNGAGKTTTIRVALGMVARDAGNVLFDGRPFDETARNATGYLPEERGLYRKSRVLNTIEYFACLKGLGRAEARARGLAWLERFGLGSRSREKVESLSKGNQQKVQFIIAVIHDPSLVVLDEPFSGLDPINQSLLKDILLELRQSGKAVIYSTHQLEQAEKLCDRISLINRGRVVVEGTVAGVKSRHGRNSVRVEFEGDGAFLPSLPGIAGGRVFGNYAELELGPGASTGDILRKMAAKLDIRKFELTEPSLDAIFLAAVGGTVAPGAHADSAAAPAAHSPDGGAGRGEP